ncbi:hypothetical protein BDE02_19G113500 [Populus trichocarpa]|nr:hypothetical protein BDE02_19G113500 [Populus trichocarpa]
MATSHQIYYRPFSSIHSSFGILFFPSLPFGKERKKRSFHHSVDTCLVRNMEKWVVVGICIWVSNMESRF